MQKKLTYFFLYFTVTSTCFSMHQLARPAITQASAAIATIAPQLRNTLRNCATNSSTSQSGSKIEDIENKTARINPEDLAQLFQYLLDEQKKQTKLLEEIKKQDDSFFADFISRRTMLWIMMFSMFTISNRLMKVNDKLDSTNNKLNSINGKLMITINKLDEFKDKKN